MRLLLLGRNGQTGWELQRALAPLGEVVAPSRHDKNGLCGDLERPGKLMETVRSVKPAVIVNAAAYTAVDKAESQPDAARKINATAPGTLARAALECNALLVHYSSDYVFNGTGTKAWNETDMPEPLNVYGQTKLEGEELIRNSGCRHLIFRTSWLYSSRRTNFLKTILKLACDGDKLQVIDDQYGAPTGAELLADVTGHAIISVVHDTSLSGTYHVAAAGETTWYGYACYLVGCARQAGWPVRVNEQAIERVSSHAFPAAAERPRNSRLNCSLIEKAFGLRMPQWEAGVARTITELNPEDTGCTRR